MPFLGSMKEIATSATRLYCVWDADGLRYEFRRPLDLMLEANQSETAEGCEHTPYRRKTISGGGKGTRTPDLLHAKQLLSQLSYAPDS